METLTPEDRRARQHETLRATPRPYGVDARVIFWLEDRVWGTARTLSKFKARELVARSPYRAWAHAPSGEPSDNREAENERAHWQVLNGLLAEDERHDNPIRFGLLPALGAGAMYAFTRLLHHVNPRRSFQLNADIEDHAEHEYAQLVAEHPEWETLPYDARVDGYGAYESRADVLRQICCDEGAHKALSLQRTSRDDIGAPATPA